jgi:hypothetical protein
MHYRRLRNKDWEKLENMPNSWKVEYLSIGGRLVLINSVLTSLPMFKLSFFEVSKGVLKKSITSDLGFSDNTIAKKRNIG